MTNDLRPEPQPGAVDCGDGLVSFGLFAPGKASVSLIGEFNDWDRAADPMQPVTDGWWYLEKQLGSGSHTYQFAVDGEIVISDPYARSLAEDSEYDPPRAIVDVGAPAFEWRHDDWYRPWFSDLIIYEIHVNDFTEQANFRGVIEKLPYLRDLGVNAIELMPIFEFKGDLGWGYNPAYFFSVECAYGSPDDFRELVDQAHGHGIAVILDLVLAHTAHRHPFNKLYLYHESPWYGRSCGEQNQFGFPELDHSREATQRFVADVQRYWLTEYHVDGFRYDYCHGIGFCDEIGMPKVVKTAREARADAYLIAEYSPENPQDVNRCDLDGAWHVGGRYKLMAMLCEGQVGDHSWDDFEETTGFLDPWKQGYDRSTLVVNFLESHDEQRLMWDVMDAGMSEEAARFKSALGAIVLFTMPGEPMLYHGQEWGEATERSTERNTLHWELLDDPGHLGLQEHYRRLAWLRREHPALRSETFSLDASYPDQKALVYHRWHDAGDVVVVACNFSPGGQEINVPFPTAGRWRDVVSGRTVEVEGAIPFALDGSTGAVFVKE